MHITVSHYKAEELTENCFTIKKRWWWRCSCLHTQDITGSSLQDVWEWHLFTLWHVLCCHVPWNRELYHNLTSIQNLGPHNMDYLLLSEIWMSILFHIFGLKECKFQFLSSVYNSCQIDIYYVLNFMVLQ